MSYPTEHEVTCRTDFMIHNIKTSSKYRRFIDAMFSDIPKEEMWQVKEFTDMLEKYRNTKDELSEADYDALMLPDDLAENYCKYYGLTTAKRQVK